MVIYSSPTSSIYTLNNNSGNSGNYIFQHYPINIGSQKENTVFTSFDSLFVPYSIYSGLLPCFSDRMYIRKANPFDILISHHTLDMNLSYDSGHYYRYTHSQDYESQPFFAHTDNQDFILDKAYYEQGWVNTSSVKSIAFKSPLILAGWGASLRSRSEVKNKSDQVYINYELDPEYPELQDPKQYKVGPLNLGWDELRGVWRPFRPSSFGIVAPFVPTQSTLPSPFVDKMNLGNTSITCLSKDMYSTYICFMNINGEAKNFNLSYSGNCTWTGEEINVSNIYNKKHTIKPILTIDTRTENSRPMYCVLLNFATVINETDNSNFNVNYINHVYFNPTITYPLYLISGPRLWKGNSSLLLVPANLETVDNIKTKHTIELFFASLSTGQVPSGTHGQWCGTNIIKETVFVSGAGSLYSASYSSSIDFFDRFNTSCVGISGSKLHYCSGFLDTNTQTYTLELKTSRPGHTGIHSFVKNYSSGLYPWVHYYHDSGFYIGFAIYEIS